MLTATEAAQALGVSKRHLYALAAKGLLPCYRFGGAVRFDAADLDAYKASCRSASTPAISGGATFSTARLGPSGRLPALHRQNPSARRRPMGCGGAGRRED
jgi:excisionase family DNA binding protein